MKYSSVYITFGIFLMKYIQAITFCTVLHFTEFRYTYVAVNLELHLSKQFLILSYDDNIFFPNGLRHIVLMLYFLL